MAKLRPKRLSETEFEKSFKNVPRVSVNLLISDSNARILLAKRNIPPFLNYWHFPGSLLLKNELIADCQKRVAKKELGIELSAVTPPKLLGAFDNIEADPRGHMVDLVYGATIRDISKLKPTKETSDIRFFERLPYNIGFNHRETLHKLGYKDRE